MHRKEDLYIKAITLRLKGFSQNEIRKRIPIAQGTISRWCHDVLLTEKQKERLIRKRDNNPFIRYLRKQAFQSKKEAKIWADEQIDKIQQIDIDRMLLIVGAMLYWAEGTKRGQYKGVEFTNTDPNMILTMMEFFRKILGIPENKFRIIVRIGKEGEVKRAENYWSKLTKVSKKQFNKPELLNLQNNNSLKRYPYGMCRIVVHDISKLRRIMTLIEKLVEKFVPVAQWIRAEAS